MAAPPMRWIAAAALAAWIAAAAPPAAADGLLEAPRNRQGYYLSLGGRATISYGREDGESIGPYNGFTTAIRLGQMITRKLGAGLSIDAGGASGDGETTTLFGLGLAGQVELATNLAVHASVGLGVVSIDDPDEDELRGAVGAAYSLGASYDWFPFSKGSGGFAITPTLMVRAVPSTDVDAFMVFFGVDLSYWSGLPKNQLDLPPDKAFR